MLIRIDKRNFKIALLLVCISIILSFLGEILYHEEKHFTFERIFFFEGLFGFFGALLLTIVVKIVGFIVSRKEESYDEYYSS